jgi:hypothetical protein
MKVGLEIELIYNAQKLSVVRGSYHGGATLSKFWEVQSDTSISPTRNKFPISETCEFVTRRLIPSKRMLRKAIRELRSHFLKNYVFKQKMDEFIDFNDSCGAHIHFSIPNYKYFDKCPEHLFDKARIKFFELLENSKVLSNEVKHLVKLQYNRSYARIMPTSEIRQLYERRAEWNFQSERNNKGMEWRSFNTRGVKTWVEFYELYSIAWDTLEYLNKNAVKWSDNLPAVEIPHKKKARKKTYKRTYIHLEKTPKDIEVDITINKPSNEVIENVQLEYTN